LYDGASLQVNIDSGYATFYNNGIRPSTDSLRNNGITSQRWLNTYTDTITIGDGVDAILTADAADELALKNSTNAQAFHVYNTDDGVNYERLEVKWDTDVCYLDATSAGTGIDRNLYLRSGADSGVKIKTNAVDFHANDWNNSKLTIGAASITARQQLRPSASGILLGTSTSRWGTTYTEGIATDVETFTAASDTLDALNNVALCDCTSTTQSRSIYLPHPQQAVCNTTSKRPTPHPIR
jgi:hypothetical protein